MESNESTKRSKGRRGRGRGRGDSMRNAWKQEKNPGKKFELELFPRVVEATALTDAVRNFDVELIDSILKNDQTLVNYIDQLGKTPMTTLCSLPVTCCNDEEKSFNVVQILLRYGATALGEDQCMDTPLYLSCRSLNLRLFQALVESLDHNFLPYASLLVDALESADFDPIKIIKKAPKDATLEEIQLLFDSVNTLDAKVLAMVQYLAECYERNDVCLEELWKRRSGSGQTALHLVMAKLLPRTALYLLDHSFNPSVHNLQSMMPVHVLETTAVDMHSTLVRRMSGKPRKKTRNNEQLPYKFQKAFFAPVIQIISALGDVVGFEKFFAHFGPHIIKSRWLKNLLVASLGFSTILQKMLLRTLENGRQRTALSYLSHIAGLFRLMKQPVSPNQRIAFDIWNEAFRNVDSNHVSHILTLVQLKEASASVSTAWTYILLEIFNTGVLPWHHLSFYHELMNKVLTSAKSFVFQLETESYEHDEEYQIFLMLVQFEMLVVIGLLTKPESLRDVLAPIKDLVQLLSMVLQVIHHNQDNPDRFIVCLFLIQIGYQIDDSLASKEATLSLCDMIREQICQPNQKYAPWKDVSRQSPAVPCLLRNISQHLPVPSIFLDWIQQYRAPVNILLQSDPRNLRYYLHQSILEMPGFVDLHVKIAYFGAVAEDRGTQLSLQVNRHTQSSLFVEFVVQQIISTPVSKLGGEIEVSFMHEPGAGMGPLREFFEMVRQYFFNPGHTFEAQQNFCMASTVHSIGLSWLQMARKETKPEKPHSQTSSFASYFPLVSFASENATQLCIVRRPIALNSAPEFSDDGVAYVKFEQLKLWDPLGNLAKLYVCFGRLLGLSLRHSMVLGARFPLIFWQHLLSEENLDWRAYCQDDPVVSASLEATWNHNFALDSSLDFVFETCDYVEFDNQIFSAQIELQPKGFDTVVNDINKENYVTLLAKRHFCQHLEILNCIRTGFLDALPRRDISLLRPEDVQLLVSGPVEIDVADLKAHVEYARTCWAGHPTIVQFWSVVQRMTPPQLEKLLVFWTGSALPPMFGFGNTHSDQVAWSIEVTSATTNAGRSSLPQAHTCDRKLVLPPYSSEVEMEAKLLLALEYGSFGYDRL